MKTRQVHLIARPDAAPKAEHFKLVSAELPPLRLGEVLVRNTFMSIDPYMRRSMDAVATDLEPWPLNKALDGPSVGTVVQSRNPAFDVGDTVESMSGWQEHFISAGDAFIPYISANSAIAKRDLALVPSEKDFLGILGVASQTGYFGMMCATRMQAGETCVVSSAAGPVGSMACQLARIHGMRVVASAGTEGKVNWLRDALKVDYAFNYKVTPYAEGLAAGCPNGIDLVLECASPEHLSACFAQMNDQKTILIAGLVGIYSTGGKVHDLQNFEYVLDRFLTVKSYPFMAYLDHYDQFVTDVIRWRGSGELVFLENIVQGLEAAPQAIEDLLSGGNHGKILVAL